MDFFNQRNSQSKPTNPAMPTSSHPEPHKTSSRRKHKGIAFLKIAAVSLLFAATILVVAVLIKLVVGGPKSETAFVKTNKYQAVFLTGNQVYFGKITSLNDKYVRIQDVYYLRVNQQVQPDQKSSTSASNDNVTLAKLGIELHCPEDAMTINASQVSFWENLNDDGQVVKAIKAFKDQNKEGVKCSQPGSSSSNSSTPAKQ